MINHYAISQALGNLGFLQIGVHIVFLNASQGMPLGIGATTVIGVFNVGCSKVIL